MIRFVQFAASVSVLTLAGCANLAPVYDQPTAPVPASFEGGLPAASASLTWQDMVTSPELSSLIDAALENNRDLQAAAANTRIARARLNVSRAARLPVLTGSASTTASDDLSGNDAVGAASYFNNSSAQLGVASWELDFFGKIQNQVEAANQSYLSTASAEHAARISVAASVAETWMQLAADQQLLELALETEKSQSESLYLTQELFEVGTANELDARRASASVESARAQAAQFKALVRQDLNTLRLLVGSDLPVGIETLAAANPLPVETQLATGTSSEILLARPDIIAAEYQLLAANANIGAARAAFFPSISLTGSAGAVSGDLGDLFTNAGATGWSFGPSVSLPIFDAGARRGNLRVTEAQMDLALAQYEGAIQSAFREASDAIAVGATIDDRVQALEQFVEDTGTTLSLSNERFRLGADSYLSVLDAQRESFTGRQALIQARLDKGLNTAGLYRAVGVN